MPDDLSSHDSAARSVSTPEVTPGAASANATNGSSNKRKRGAASAGPVATSASSRGVANLTPEQLERKRANDREAQRAIRERTKQQIERLNDRIKELESSQPYQDLQAVLQQKEAVQQENEEIKRQLASFMAVFQRYMTVPSGLEELATAAERNALPYTPSDQPQILSQQDHFPPPPVPSDHLSPHPAASVGSPASQSSLSRTFQYGSVQPQGQNRSWLPPSNSPYESHRNIHPDLAYGQNDERLGVDFLLDASNQRLAKSLNGASQSPQTPSTESQGHFSTLPRRVPATCPLDAILLDAVAERNRARSAGLPREEVVGPLYPNWNHLLNKNTTTHAHAISKLMTDILRTFPDLSKLPEQVAVTYIMFLVNRWEVDPSRENYERLPEWVRPLPSQLFTPHPCWLDYLPWPRLRDAAVQTHPFPNFDTFFVPYTTTLRVNWPYAPADVLLPTSGPPHPMTNAASPGSVSSHGDSGHNFNSEPIWRLNPAFETHLRNLDNWSLGPLFRDTYPDWVSAVRIQDDSGNSSSSRGR